MYQVDCLTKKINANFFNYMKENKKELQECIQLLDNWYYEHMFKGEQQNG